LHTNDLHSAFNSSKELTERNPFGLGGLANLSTLIKQNKTDNTVLVDAGDWSEGNAYYFVDAGTNMLQALELLGYDATVVGNHDFLNGPIEMANTVQRANLKKLKVLGLNKNLENEALSAYKEYIEKNILNYSITSLPNGLRIAFIGLLCVDLDYRDYFKPGILTDAIKAASRALTEIRSQNLADVIIILSHNKFELNLEWAKLISDQNGIGPDIIISGHSHVKTPKIKTVLNASRPVLVAEAGYWGQFLGRMDLQYNTGTKTVELKNYNLIPVTPTSNPDPEILKFIEEQNKKLNEKFPNEFNFIQNGLLMVSQTKEGVKTAVEELSLVEKHDVKGKVLTPEEITKLEPSLIGNIQGGVYFTDDAHAEPLKVVKTLEKLALSLGVKIITNCEVYDFKVSNNKIHSLLTTKGEIAADLYVLATASWSVRLAKILKLNVPILGGKGYAIITDPLEVTPKIPLMLVEKKIAITPRENTLRIAGTLELVDQDDSITTRRVEAIIKGTRQFLRLPQNPKTYEIWRGLRPCTPDGVPMIGKSHKHENLYLCTGHQMLGLQSAPGSARLLGDLMTGSEPIVDPTPFRVSRF